MAWVIAAFVAGVVIGVVGTIVFAAIAFNVGFRD
jgi:hypothetical protein